MEVPITEKYQEYIGSLDLLMEFYNIRLQGEFIAVKRKLLHQDQIVDFRDATMNSALRVPGLAVYGLIAYTLPIEEYLDSIEIMPYVMFEYNDGKNELLNLTFKTLSTGVNILLRSNIVVKCEYQKASYEITGFISMKATSHSLSTQLAVSF